MKKNSWSYLAWEQIFGSPPGVIKSHKKKKTNYDRSDLKKHHEQLKKEMKEMNKLIREHHKLGR